jgi:hypothetical protein
MTTPPFSSRGESPLNLDGVPGEEEVSAADAAERVDLDPEEQHNRTDPEPGPEPEYPEGDRS